DKKSYAAALQASYNQLLNLANTTDSSGNYIFAGSKNATPPFVRDETTGRVDYAGSNSALVVNVDHGSSLSSTVTGTDLFLTSNNENIFSKLQSAIDTLNNSTTTNNDPALSGLVTFFSDSLSQLGSIQSEVASRLKTIDQLDTLGSSRSLQLSQELSSLQDLDYNKAIAEFSRQQMVLQAAQQTFAQVSKMSLFDYIKN
ncbi:MAG: hypothetical protein EBR59_11030, partial [Methylococcaceae bacterium]|nr:hypothetical protein [Methylococcaceae bacterium]